MRNDLLLRLRGELVLEISGDHPERLINLALQQGMEIRNVTRCGENMRLCLPLADFYRLRPLARRSGCRFHIISRHGLPFTLAFFRRRPLLLLLGALACFVLSWCCSLVGGISISSPYELSAADSSRVEQLAEEAGLKVGSSRWNMDLEQAEQYILDQFRELFYVEIFEHGSQLEIRVVKRTDIPEEEQIKLPGNIIASASGVIESVLVRRGTAAVEQGQTVTAGQVLIAGFMVESYLAADGIVTATVYGEGYGECAQEQTLYERSGRFCQSIRLKVGEGASILIAGREPNYEYRESNEWVETLPLWRNNPAPVEILFSEIYELIPYKQSLTADQALEQARRAACEDAYAALLEQCPQGLLGEVSYICEEIYLKDGVLRVRAVAQALAEIGSYCAMEEELLQELQKQMLPSDPTS